MLKKVSELESKLKRETLRADFYEEMVAFGKEVYGIDLKKGLHRNDVMSESCRASRRSSKFGRP